MDQMTPAMDHYIAEFARVERTLPGNDKINAQRRDSFQAFSRHGFPTVREEDWKYTNLRSLVKCAFEVSSEPGEISSQTLSEHLPDELDAHLAVVVDGHFSTILSQLADLPDGTHVGAFATYLADDPEATIRHPLIDKQPGSPSDMNAAFVTDGVHVMLDNGAVLDKPLHVVSLTTGSKPLQTAQVRHRFVLGDNSQATIIEHYIGLGEETGFTNVVTEVVAQANAHLTRIRIQEESENTYHIASMFARQHRDSCVHTHSFDLGSKLARIGTNSHLVEDSAESCYYGVYAPTGKQHIDNHNRVDHDAEHGISREVFKGVVNDKGTGVFNGKVVVHKYAQKTDSEQKTDALLLSKRATVDAKPELEIYADDVKCAHGSTVGQLDESAIFYLRTRGMNDSAARAILTYAFAHQQVERLDNEALRHHIEAALMAKLPGGELFSTAI